MDVYEGFDPLAEALSQDGFCDHGVFVGGTGPDFMCGWCEDGVTWAEFVCILRLADNRRRRRETRDAYALAVVMAGGPKNTDLYPDFVYQTFGAIVRCMS